MIREMHFVFFLLFISNIWKVAFHIFGIEPQHLQALKFHVLPELLAALACHLLKRMQKQGSKQRSIISMLNNWFLCFWSSPAGREGCTLFLYIFFILNFLCFLVVCLFVCLFVCFCGYHVIIALYYCTYFYRLAYISIYLLLHFFSIDWHFIL